MTNTEFLLGIWLFLVTWVLFFQWLFRNPSSRYERKLAKLRYEIEREGCMRQLMFERELTNRKVLDPSIRCLELEPEPDHSKRVYPLQP